MHDGVFFFIFVHECPLDAEPCPYQVNVNVGCQGGLKFLEKLSAAGWDIVTILTILVSALTGTFQRVAGLAIWAPRKG